MNINILIDAIVRQTTVLIAQLATTARARASLSQTANQVFLDLVSELKEQGLGNTLIADMFGLSLRTYHNKMRRLSESSTERGESLWNAVLAFVQEKKTVARAEVLMRFARDDERSVRSVLNDLVATGMLFSKGTGDRIVYRAASPVEYDVGERPDDAQGLANLLWISIARHSPIKRSRLLQTVRIEESELDHALAALLADGRVQATRTDNDVSYSSEECIIDIGESAGWEASIFDHYQAMVIAICKKLQLGTSGSKGEAVGGSTYGFEVWPGHPLQQQVLGFLQDTRERAADLRRRVDQHNATASAPDEQRQRVIAYVGQTVIDAVEPSEMEEP